MTELKSTLNQEQLIRMYERFREVTGVSNFDYTSSPRIVKTTKKIDVDSILKTIDVLLFKNTFLKSKFVQKDGKVIQVTADFIASDILTIIEHKKNEVSMEELALLVAPSFSKWDIFLRPLWRVFVIHSTTETYFNFVCHHLISDGVTQNLIVNEFFQTLETIDSGDLPSKNSDKQIIQKIQSREAEMLTNDSGQTDSYWKHTIDNLPRLLDGRQIQDPVSKSELVLLPINGALFEKVNLFAEKVGLSLFQFVLYSLFRASFRMDSADTSIQIAKSTRSIDSSFDTSNVVGNFYFEFPFRFKSGHGTSQAEIERFRNEYFKIPSRGLDFLTSHSSRNWEQGKVLNCPIGINFMTGIKPAQLPSGYISMSPLDVGKIHAFMGPFNKHGQLFFNDFYWGSQIRFWFNQLSPSREMFGYLRYPALYYDRNYIDQLVGHFVEELKRLD